MKKRELRDIAAEIIPAHEAGDLNKVRQLGEKYAQEYDVDFSDLMQAISEISHEIVGKEPR